MDLEQLQKAMQDRAKKETRERQIREDTTLAALEDLRQAGWVDKDQHGLWYTTNPGKHDPWPTPVLARLVQDATARRRLKEQGL